MSDQTTLPYLDIGDQIVVDGVVYEINREPGATTPHLDAVGDIREPGWDDAVYQDQDQVVPRLLNSRPSPWTPYKFEDES